MKKHKLQDKRVDPGVTREIIIKLRDEHGVTYAELGRQVDMNQISIGRIVRGASKEIYQETARRIAAYYKYVRENNIVYATRNPFMTPGYKTSMALRGLAVQGYTRQWIVEQTRLPLKSITNIRLDPDHPNHQPLVTIPTEKKIIALARSVGSKRGDSAEAARQARKKGWEPTIAHDWLV